MDIREHFKFTTTKIVVFALLFIILRVNGDSEEGRGKVKAKYVLIRHPASNLVLDASVEEVTLQEYKKSELQLWELEPTINGKFIFVNKGNKRALDVKDGVAMGATVITYDVHGMENQQFYINSDGSIVSTVNKLTLEIREDNVQVGSGLIVNPKQESPKQKFELEPVVFQ